MPCRSVARGNESCGAVAATAGGLDEVVSDGAEALGELAVPEGNAAATRGVAEANGANPSLPTDPRLLDRLTDATAARAGSNDALLPGREHAPQVGRVEPTKSMISQGSGQWDFTARV
jgi:hypothetical protein